MAEHLKVKGWQDVLESACDRPKESAIRQNWLMRFVMAPLVTAIAVGLVLAVIGPPFACSRATSRLATPKLSFARISAWMIFSAAAFLAFSIFRGVRVL